METAHSECSAASERKARICMPTSRLFSRAAARAALYEAQDVIAQIDDVDLIQLEPEAGQPWREAWQRRLIWQDPTGKVALMNPGIKPVRLKRDYEMFVIVCQQWCDLLYANAIQGWQDRCRLKVCWLDEIWAAQLGRSRRWLHLLRQFDYVFVGLRATAQPLSAAIGQACTYLPPAVDMVRFSPYPSPPHRGIDVLSLGRRWPGVHNSLREMARASGTFYVHDTVSDAGDMRLQDFSQHRDLFANMAKRSRFFMVGPAKMGIPEETGGQLEIGYRFFEGASAGAVLLGQAPDCPSFHDLFGWPESVVGLQPDGSDTEEVVRALLNDPERRAVISRRNALEALRRHDWMYRWRQVMEAVGLQPGPACLQRAQHLHQLEVAARGASTVGQEDSFPAQSSVASPWSQSINPAVVLHPSSP